MRCEQCNDSICDLRRTAGECLRNELLFGKKKMEDVIPSVVPPDITLPQSKPEIPQDSDEWESYRKDVAKDILVALIRGGWDESYAKRYSRIAATFANELVKVLKEGIE